MGNQKDKDLWLRRQAVQLAANLPEDGDDARKVIDYLRELAEGFMCGEPAVKRPSLHILPNRRDST